MAQSNKLLDTLLASGSVRTLCEISNANEEQVRQTISFALPTLVESMKKNSASLAGEMALSAALSSHADKDSSDVASFLRSANADDGDKIIDHILGSDRYSVESGLSKKSGLSVDQARKILAALAPLIMNVIGSMQKQKKEEGNFGGLIEVLSSVMTGTKESSLGDLFRGGFGSLFASPKKAAAPVAAAPAAAHAAKPAGKPLAAAKPVDKKAGESKPAAKKAPAKKAAAKKPAPKKAPAKKTDAKKAPVKKVAEKKPAAKKAPGKKSVAKKPAAKKASVKTKAAKKPAAKKAIAKKANAKKPAAKKAPAKKAAVKKPAIKKAPVKKTAGKKATVKKQAAKK